MSIEGIEQELLERAAVAEYNPKIAELVKELATMGRFYREGERHNNNVIKYLRQEIKDLKGEIKCLRIGRM